MLLAGALAATTLVQQQFPNVSQPTVSIGVTYSGASTTVMRDSIVKPIEDTIAGTQDLQTLSSNIQAGQATISATFAITSNQNTDLVNIQKAVQSAEHNLPTDLQPPTLAIRDPGLDVFEDDGGSAVAARQRAHRAGFRAGSRCFCGDCRRRRDACLRGRGRPEQAQRL